MKIDIESLSSYIKVQEKTFEITKSIIGNDFNQGILEGLGLVKAYLEQFKKHEERHHNANQKKGGQNG